MDLQCVVKVFDEKTKEYNENLPKSIADKFDCISTLNIKNFKINFIDGKYKVSFDYQSYNYIINRFTNYSLDENLYPDDLKIIHLKLKKYIDEKSKIPLRHIQKAFDTTLIKKLWLCDFIDLYIPSPDDIRELVKFFKICYENNLIIHASY